jgi:excisionase family DNA binding protein
VIKRTHATAGQRELLTLDDAATILSVSRDTVRRLIDRGELRIVRIGASVRIPRADINALIERCIERGDAA